MGRYARRWQAFWAQQSNSRHGSQEPQFLERFGRELQELFRENEPLRILDIGCGAGELFAPLGFDRAERYRGVDISSRLLMEFGQRQSWRPPSPGSWHRSAAGRGT